MVQNMHVSHQCIPRIWNKSVNVHASSNYSLSAVHTKKAGNTNGLKYNLQALGTELQQLPHGQHGNLTDAAISLGVSQTTINNAIASGLLHSSSLKPALTDAWKNERFVFCCNEVCIGGQFHDMFDCVHFDEKWFFCDYKTREVLLGENEPIPERVSKHKNHIQKVMFLCVVARPRFDTATVLCGTEKLVCGHFLLSCFIHKSTEKYPVGNIP